MSELTFTQRRDRVREIVLEPLKRKGLRKAKGQTREQLEEMLDRLAVALAPLDARWLVPLKEAIEAGATSSGRARQGRRPACDIWPSEAAIENWARRLSPGFAGLTQLTVTYMRSAAGKAAWQRSPFEASRLERYLATKYRPPGELDWQEIADQAAELAGRVAEAEDRIRRGVAGDGEHDKLAGWQDRRAWLEHLIFGDLDDAPELAA